MEYQLRLSGIILKSVWFSNVALYRSAGQQSLFVIKFTTGLLNVVAWINNKEKYFQQEI